MKRTTVLAAVTTFYVCASVFTFVMSCMVHNGLIILCVASVMGSWHYNRLYNEKLAECKAIDIMLQDDNNWYENGQFND